MKKLISLLVCVVVLLTACCVATEVEAEPDYPLKIYRGAEFVSYKIIVDKKTGVNYIFIYDGSVTPRLNTDGSLYITK